MHEGQPHWNQRRKQQGWTCWTITQTKIVGLRSNYNLLGSESVLFLLIIECEVRFQCYNEIKYCHNPSLSPSPKSSSSSVSKFYSGLWHSRV